MLILFPQYHAKLGNITVIPMAARTVQRMSGVPEERLHPAGLVRREKELRQGLGHRKTLVFGVSNTDF